MSKLNGFNPLRWKCEESGCFNVKRRWKIEYFADDLPGRLAFSDIDATAEVNGHFLFLEFKEGAPREIPTGQRIYIERLTSLSTKITAVIVCGNAEDTEVSHYRWAWNGAFSPWTAADTVTFKAHVRHWAERAKQKEAA